MALTFARPIAFWLLLVLPLFALLGVMLGVRRRRLPRAALGLRLAVIALLSLTLAEPLLAAGGDGVNVVFVVDRSRSLTSDSATDADAWVDAGLDAANASDRAAVVTFGASPLVAAPAARVGDVERDWRDQALDAAEQEYTNVESALALARALPLGGSRRVVLLSDGAENVGTALDQAAQAAADGIPIDVVPMTGIGEDDLRVEGASAPSATWQGEPLEVLASVASGIEAPGRVELWVDGQAFNSQQTIFPVGRSSHTFPVQELSPGFHALEVRVIGDAASDRFPENNILPLALIVRDQPKLLLVVPDGSDPDVLRGALERRGATVTTMPPGNVPSRLSELGVYDAVILNNVPAPALTIDQMAALQQSARTLGRGLIVVGGTSSYGPGQYAGTLLEDAMPVTVKVTDGRQRQKVAVLLIMDKSGSMSYSPSSGTNKIDMAKEAVRVAARSLADGDQVGILVFSDQQQWILPMRTIESDSDRATIDQEVAKITADGGTEIYPALSIGFDAIRNTDADVRHIVLLTDGKSRTGTRESYQKLVEDVVADRTTLSTVAIGDDADTDLLQFLAEQGNGRYHFTDKPEDIPKLTLAEAQAAGSQSVLRGEFRAIQTQPSPILLGFDPAELPLLDGYDFAETKPDAQLVLSSDRDDPVLAKWQYGLGRVLAWTADDGSDLAAKWSSWSRYDEFWNSMVRWSLPDPENRPLQVSTVRDGPETVLTVRSVDAQSADAALGETTVTITTPSGAVASDLPLYQSGPGEYQVRVAAPEPGAYKLDLQQQRGREIVAETAGFAVPSSPELQPAPDAQQLLGAIAARTGGRVLAATDAGLAFDDAGLRGTARRDYRPIWYVPLVLALVLLLVEIAVRTRFAPRLRFWRRMDPGNRPAVPDGAASV